MRIYFDENFSPHLIRGMKCFQSGRGSEDVDVLSVADEFGRGCPDETWIPGVASRHGVILTQDLNIHRLRAQWELSRANKMGIFFFKPPKKEKAWSYWDIVQLVIRHWPTVKWVAKEEQRPFGYVVELTRSKMTKL